MFAFASEDAWSSQEMILEQFVAEAAGKEYGLLKLTNRTDGDMFGSWNGRQCFFLWKGNICYVRTDTVSRFDYSIGTLVGIQIHDGTGLS